MGNILNQYPNHHLFYNHYDKVFLNKSSNSYKSSIFKNTQCQIDLENLQDYQSLLKLLQLRKNSSFLVSADIIRSQNNSTFWNQKYQIVYKVESIPINLSNLSQIPFPDILHVAYQSLKGFCQLSLLKGFFHVTCQLIGVNYNQIVKIWMNQEYNQNQCLKETSQLIMVREIITLIQDKILNDTMPQDDPSLFNYIFRNSRKIGFTQAINQIIEFSFKYNNGLIPKKLNCLDSQAYTQMLISTQRIERQPIIYREQTNQNKLVSNQQIQNEQTQNFIQKKLIKIKIHTFNRRSSLQSEEKIIQGNNQSLQLPEKNNLKRKKNKISLKNGKK